MRNLVRGLVLLLVACAPPPSAQSSEWPAGSKIAGGSFCFEHSTGDGWKPIALELPDGGTPVKGTVFTSALVPAHLLGRASASGAAHEQ